MSKPWRDEETLRELYIEEGLSTIEVGERLGCADVTVSKWLKENDIPVEPSTREKPVHHCVEPKGYEVWCHTTTGNQYNVAVHRLLAVAEYGIDAVEGKDVHHKNGIPWDNRPENLEVLTREDHMGHHSKKYGTEELLDYLREWREEHGELPTSTDFDERDDKPSSSAYWGRFGSFKKAKDMVR